jgi:tripartite-type tricarboxylate transporter receptor subunit TctC
LKTTIIIDRRKLVGSAVALALAPKLVWPLRAETWPARPVFVVVPFAPGGSTDVVARIVAERLSTIWGQHVVVENKPGAGSNFGAELVASSAPDGYTMLIGTSSLTTSRNLYHSLRYELSDLAPVTLVCTFPLLMLAPTTSPAKSIAEFIAFARANRGKVTFASPGVGTVPHLAGELFKQMAGIEMTHIPYRGDAPALTDTMAGRVDLQISGSAMIEHVRSGQVRGLAVTTAERSPAAPELPTIAESGLAGFDVTAWFALFVAARTPEAIITKMQIDTANALREAAVKAKLDRIGVIATGSTPQELGAFVKSEVNKWGGVIKSANITLDK